MSLRNLSLFVAYRTNMSIICNMYHNRYWCKLWSLRKNYSKIQLFRALGYIYQPSAVCWASVRIARRPTDCSGVRRSEMVTPGNGCCAERCVVLDENTDSSSCLGILMPVGKGAAVFAKRPQRWKRIGKKMQKSNAWSRTRMKSEQDTEEHRTKNGIRLT